MEQVKEIINNNLDNPQFGVEMLSHELHMHRVQLNRKVKQLVGQSPSEIIRDFRLQFAKKLLEQGNHTVTDISYMVGFSEPSSFTTSFKKKYGYPPSKFKHKKKAY